MRHPVAKLNELENKLGKIKAKHANWHPADLKVLHAWEKRLVSIRRQIEFSQHPVVKSIISYKQRAINDINNVLMNKIELTDMERRILMEKRNMYKADLNLLVPDETVVESLESAIAYEFGGGVDNPPSIN